MYIAVKASVFLLSHSVFANYGSSVRSLPNEKSAIPKRWGLIDVGMGNMDD
jgi:hypothetical protein